MKSILFAGLLCTFLPGAVQASMNESELLINADQPRIENPETIVQRYLAAVDQGELQSYGQTLVRSMLDPVRVEYVYDLYGRTTRIKVHSNLKQPLPVPGQSGCQVRSVGAVMEDGHITEIESYIWENQ